jgi:hypothetical protein
MFEDGLQFEEKYLAEIKNFVNASSGVRHENIMSALVLKDTLRKLYQRELEAEDSEALDDPEVDFRDLFFKGMN